MSRLCTNRLFSLVEEEPFKYLKISAMVVGFKCGIIKIRGELEFLNHVIIL